MDYMALLDDVIVNELKNLKDTKGETDEYKATVECVTKLMDRSIEIKKLTYDSYETAIMGRGRLLPLGVDSAQPSRVFVLCLNTSLRIFFSTPASTSLRQ